METIYYSCDWIERLDKIDIHYIYESMNKCDCQIAIIGSMMNDDGYKILKIAIKSQSITGFQQFIGEVGEQYGAGAKSWYPIDEDVYLSGKQILMDEESRDDIHKSVTSLMTYFKQNYELHHRLTDNKGYYQIYRADWLINRLGLSHLMEFFDIGENSLFSLAYIKIQNNQNYFYIRFFAIATSLEIVEKFFEKTKNLIGVMNWVKITNDDLPNIVYFNPQRTLDGYLQSKLNEELYLRSISNEKLLHEQDKL